MSDEPDVEEVDGEIVEGTSVEVEAVVEIPEARRATAVWRHPDRDTIHHLLQHGRAADWIQYWLEDRYPMVEEDEEGTELAHPDADKHRRWRTAASTIDAYRAEWMPECVAGVSVVNPGLEDLIGRRLPGAAHHELDIIEAGVNVAQANLERALKTDAELGMLQQVTLEANTAMIAAAQKLIEQKAKLGVRGYEIVPDRSEQTVNQTVHSTNRSVSVELHGRVSKDGQVGPGDSAAVKLMKDMMGLPPEERAQLVEAAQSLPEDADAAGEAA